jgi:hypothetical protein
MDKNKFRLLEIIKPNYVTPEQVRKMIDAKYRWGEFNIKSEDELKKLYEVTENVFNNEEDPQNSMKTVSAKDYDRVLANKLYEISSNVGQEQLQNIINDNIKIDNENNLNVPSSSSSSFSDLSSFKEEDKELPGEGMNSEDETDTDISGAETDSSNILPEVQFQAVQDNNNSNRSVARPRDFVPKPPSEDQLLRRAVDHQMDNRGIGGFK